jgi:hypothetical protein
MLGVYLELPPDLVARFDALADRMGRTRKAELILAMERHLAYPPKPPEPAPKPPPDPYPEEAMSEPLEQKPGQAEDASSEERPARSSRKKGGKVAGKVERE